MLDVWVCSSCHSLNRERAHKCYKCGATRSTATGQGADLRAQRAIQAQLIAPVRNTLPLAGVASIFLLGLVGLEIVTSVIELQIAPQVNDAVDAVMNGGGVDTTPLDSLFAGLDSYTLPTLLCFLASWAAIGAWLGVSVANMPGLGAGAPPIDGVRVFLYSLIPIYTFRHVPRVTQALLYKLDPRAGGMLVLTLAWVGLFGSYVLSWLARWFIGVRIASDAFNATSLEEFGQSVKGLMAGAVFVDILCSTLIVVGVLALIATVLRVERRRAARVREIETALATA